MKPTILFEDQHLVVLSKPAGLLSQGEKKGEENLVDQLRDYFGRHYVGLVHRLDRNTSGLMVVAKRTKAARRLTESLQNEKLMRTYRALVLGEVKDQAQWKHWLLKDTQKNKVKVVAKKQTGAKEATLKIKPIRTGPYHQQLITLAEFHLETGRSHQIRVQSSYEGHPLLGDLKYDPSQEKLFSRPALHSYEIRFPHPMTNEILTYQDDYPADMKKVIEKL